MQKSSFFKSVQFKFFDVIILIIFMSIAAASVFYLRSSKGKKASVIIDTPFDEYIYSIDQDKELKIKGLIGISIIKIENGSVRFLDSPCPNKTCVACAPIRENMEWTACLPNQVFIRIEKETDEKTQSPDVSSF